MAQPRKRATGRNSRPAKLQSNFSPRTPKHHRKPRSTRHQRARRINNLQNLTKSAKPPPPVQIRAAPPIFLRNQRLTDRRESASDFLGKLEAPPGFEPGVEVLQTSSGSASC